jgi:CO/xanthine dehydrogenase Mo-binding subunit
MGEEENDAMTEQTTKVVGQSVHRRDGMGHVTGKTVFVDDIKFPDMLHLKMVRSPVPHAKIIDIDFSEAEKVPGFVTALTHKDVPKNVYTILVLIGVGPDEEPVLAEKKVLYKGEQIAAIVAESEAAAMEAAGKVKLELEEIPAVFDVEESLGPGAPILKDWGTNYFVYEGHHCRRVRYGDVEQGFADADYIVEGRYQTSPIEHAPTETTGCVVRPEADGRYTVYTNTQALFFSLDNTALILEIPFNKLHFVGGTVGGGFGGKVDVIVEPIATLAAMKTGRPVRYVFSRDEEMRVSSTRGAWRMLC